MRIIAPGRLWASGAVDSIVYFWGGVAGGVLAGAGLIGSGFFSQAARARTGNDAIRASFNTVLFMA